MTESARTELGDEAAMDLLKARAAYQLAENNLALARAKLTIAERRATAEFRRAMDRADHSVREPS